MPSHKINRVCVHGCLIQMFPIKLSICFAQVVRSLVELESRLCQGKCWRLERFYYEWGVHARSTDTELLFQQAMMNFIAFLVWTELVLITVSRSSAIHYFLTEISKTILLITDGQT